MVIELLADRPDLALSLAPEIARHWSVLIPEETTASRVAKLRSHCNRDALPIAWVAHSDGEPLATAALRTYDLEGRDDLTPWLGGVFVLQKYRGRGVASALCGVAEAKAWQLGYKRVYLFTLDQQSLYSRLGWQIFGDTMWRGREGRIMFKDHPSAT